MAVTERLDGPQDPPVDSTGGPTSGPADTPRPRRRLGPSPTIALLFLLPAALLLGIWVVYPIGYSIVRSLYDSTGGVFVGLENYGTIFSDEGTLRTVRNNLIWVKIGRASCRVRAASLDVD